MGLVFVKKVWYNASIHKRKGGDYRMGDLFYNTEDQGPLINDQTFIVLMVIGIIVLAAVLVVAVVTWWPRFQREYQHLNLRIEQAQSERKRQHYIRRRRSLLLSLIPFVRYKK